MSEDVAKACACVEAWGEDPDCALHGDQTDWALENYLPEDWQETVLAWRESKARFLRNHCADAAVMFKLGDRVRKVSGSSWTGHVVGAYSRELCGRKRERTGQCADLPGQGPHEDGVTAMSEPLTVEQRARGYAAHHVALLPYMEHPLVQAFITAITEAEAIGEARGMERSIEALQTLKASWTNFHFTTAAGMCIAAIREAAGQHRE